MHPVNELADHTSPAPHPSFEALSTWRAGGLDADTTQSLQSHVGACAACQRRLTDFDRTEAALRSFAPDPALAEHLRHNLSVLIRSPHTQLPALIAPTEAPLANHADERVRVLTDERDDAHGTRVASPALASTPPSGMRQPAILRPDAHQTPMRGRRTRARSLLSGALAAVAILALTLSFVAVFHLRQAQRTTGATGTTRTTETTATPPSIVVPKLSWRATTLPPGVPASAQLCGTEIIGSDVYLYVLPPLSSAGLWASFDNEQTWRRLPTPPVPANAGTPGLAPDHTNPSRLLLTYSIPQTDGTTRASQWVTFDTQATQVAWRSVPPDPRLSHIILLSSWRNVYYAQVETTSALGLTPAEGYIVVSADQMQTWRNVQAAAQEAPSNLNAVWVHPVTGQLLIEYADASLWIRSLTGDTWSRIVTPAYPLLAQGTPAATAPKATDSALPPLGNPSSDGGQVSDFVQPLAGSTEFAVCVWVDAPTVAHDSASYACSWDSGHTWRRRPQTYISCAILNECVSDLPPTFALRPDFVTSDGETVADVAFSSAGSELFLLPRNATGENQWANLGQVPGQDLTFGPGYNTPTADSPQTVWSVAPVSAAQSGTPEPAQANNYFAVVP